MQVTRKMRARIHQRSPGMARRGCIVIRPAEGGLSDCAPSAFFQGEVTGIPLKKTVCGDCSDVYSMCYRLRVLTITYKNVLQQTTFVAERRLGDAASAFSLSLVLICFAGGLCGQAAAQDANESLGP